MKKMMLVLTGAAALTAAALLPLSGAIAQPAGHAQPDSPHAMDGGPKGCQAMGHMREDMMSKMKAANDRVADLTTRMNHAADQAAEVGAMKDLLNELVSQRHEMQAAMGEMHEKMMAHMMGHMMAGMDDGGCQRVMDSMKDCPMMKDMGGMMGKGADETKPDDTGGAKDEHSAHHPK